MDRINDVGLRLETLLLFLRDAFLIKVAPLIVGFLAGASIVLLAFADGYFAMKGIGLGMILLIIATGLTLLIYRYEGDDVP